MQKNKVTITWYERADQIDESLWRECFPPPVEGSWWYKTLDDSHLHDQFKFAYGLISIDNFAVGIAPVFSMKVPIDLVMPEAISFVLKALSRLKPSLAYQHTLFIGSPCAEEGTVGLVPGVHLSQIAPELFAAAEEKAAKLKAPMIVWKDMNELDAEVLDNLAPEFGTFRMVSFPGTLVNLSSDKIDDYYKSLKGSRRYNLKKKLKRSNQLISLDTEVVQHPNPELLEEILGLFYQTYNRAKTKFEKLTPKFFQLIASWDTSYFVLLRSNETKQLVAFMLLFRFEDRVINKFLGIDYNLPDSFHLYFRLWEAALSWVLKSGAREFQSGQTGYRAKLDVGHSLVPLTNYCKHNNPLINKVFATIAKNISWSSLDKDLETYLKSQAVKASTEKSIELVVSNRN